jgi:hypothetical protein
VELMAFCLGILASMGGVESWESLVMEFEMVVMRGRRCFHAPLRQKLRRAAVQAVQFQVFIIAVYWLATSVRFIVKNDIMRQ